MTLPGAPMRVVLAAAGAEEFTLLQETCLAAGHQPVAYAYSRSMRFGERADAYAIRKVSELLAAMDTKLDLLLPAGTAGLGRALAGYRPDLLVMYGFNWILPPEVFQLPRLGTINIHPGWLPRYRGAAPDMWAIRNGDDEVGVTVHRVDEGMDTGPILARRGGVPLDEDATRASLRDRLAPVVRDLLTEALAKVVNGDPGEPQPERDAGRAPMMEPEFRRVDWSRTRRQIHNQVRVYRYIGSQEAPVARVGNQWVRLVRTSLEPAGGTRVECGDGPIWVVESAPAEPPATDPPPAG